MNPTPEELARVRELVPLPDVVSVQNLVKWLAREMEEAKAEYSAKSNQSVLFARANRPVEADCAHDDATYVFGQWKAYEKLLKAIENGEFKGE